MIELVRHALLNGTVGLDINDITNLEGCEVGGQLDHTALCTPSHELDMSIRS